MGVWSGTELAPYVVHSDYCDAGSTYCYSGHCAGDTEAMDIDGCIQATVPLSKLCESISKSDLLTAMQSHNLFYYPKNMMKELGEVGRTLLGRSESSLTFWTLLHFFYDTLGGSGFISHWLSTNSCIPCMSL